MLDACPWQDLAPASISFCEARLCGWIAEPSNALSNAAYLLPAFWVWRQKNQSRGVRLMETGAATVLAFMSFFFHSTGSRVGEMLDVSSMYVLPSLSFGVLLADRGQKMLGAMVPFIVWGSATLMMHYSGSDGIIVWGTLAICAALIERSRAQVLPAKGRLTEGILLLTCFFVGYGIWWLDKLGIACHPDNHWVTGHAIWHCFTAGSIYFFYKLHLRVHVARSAPAPAQ